MPIDPLDRDGGLAHVLGGGNTPGAYHAGAFETLHEAGRRPGWIVGPSIRAITGTVIAGNAPRCFDSSPSAIWDRWEAGRRDRADGLARLRTLDPERRRFGYLPRAD